MNQVRRMGKIAANTGVLAAGLALVAVAGVVLGGSSRFSRIAHSFAPSAGQISASVASPQNPSPAAADLQAHSRSLLSGLPLFFEPNQGQANLNPSDARAKFISHGSGYSLFLGSDGAILTLASQPSPHQTSFHDKLHSVKPASLSPVQVRALEMKLAHANPNPEISGIEPLRGKSNYLIGNDPSKWRTSIPQFARVRYADVYPGIDLAFYGNQGHLEYDFQVAPGADPSQAELEFKGAQRMELRQGSLVIHAGDNAVQLEAPVVYQEVNGQRRKVEGRFVLRGKNRAGFAIGSYDRSRELVIDPILNFSTYFGGSGDELATSVAVDGALNIYLAGSTTSTNLPDTAGFYQPALNGAGPNAYIAKITPPSGSVAASLDFVTYLGGSGMDSPVGVKVDGSGDVFVAGTTTSSNFPTTSGNAYQSTIYSGDTAGAPHVFVTELLNAGTTLFYSTYLSGNGSETATGMALDASGDVYVTGTTTSNNVANPASNIQFPASAPPQAAAYQALSKAETQFFVTEVATKASGYGSILYSTYFGGATAETSPAIAIGGGIAVDPSGNVYFSGTTNFTYTGTSSSTDFPILNAYQPCLDTPPPTVIVNPPTCTYTSSDAATDAFVTKLNPTATAGQQLVWSSYLGGAGDDSSTGIAIDAAASNVYVVGTTDSDPFVATTTIVGFASFQPCLNNLYTGTDSAANCNNTQTNPPTDAFVARVSNTTTSGSTINNISLNYFSYVGGQGDDDGTAITVDSASGAVITGWTQSPFIPTATTPIGPGPGSFPVTPYPNPIQSSLTGAQDAFVARLNTGAVVGQTTNGSWANYFGGSTDSSGNPSYGFGTGIALDVNQNTYLAGDTNAVDLRLFEPLPAASGGNYNGGYDAFVSQFQTAVNLSVSGILTLGTGQVYISAGNPATFTYTITNNGPDLASNVIFTDNFSSIYTGGVPLTFSSASISSGTCNSSSSSQSVNCGPISLQAGSTATVTVVLVPPAPSTNAGSYVCGGSVPHNNPESFNGGAVQVTAAGNVTTPTLEIPAEVSDFAMTVCPSNQSIAQAGDTAPYQVQLTPEPLFSSSITLSCANLPTGATCNFSPSQTVTMSSTSGATVNLNIPTTARPITTTANLLPRKFYAVWFALPGLALFGVGVGRDRRKRRIAGLLMLLWVCSLVVLIPACSHSSTQAPVSGTPSGNYNITVTAASGSNSKTTQITLQVP